MKNKRFMMCCSVIITILSITLISCKSDKNNIAQDVKIPENENESMEEVTDLGNDNVLNQKEETLTGKNEIEQAVSVEFNLNSGLVDNSYVQSAVITGLNDKGENVWEYETPDYAEAQLDRVSEIGINGNTYYFVEDGAVVALNVSDGSVLWKNEEFSGTGTAFVFGDDGTLYLCGYLGPDFFAVDKNGKTLCRIKTFDSQYYWPHKMEYQNNQIMVTFEGFSSGYGIENVCTVNLEDYTYSFIKNSSSAYMSEEEALNYAMEYWDIQQGEVDEETGFLYSFQVEMGPTEDDPSYYIALLWFVNNSHWSTLDYVAVNAVTGECTYP